MLAGWNTVLQPYCTVMTEPEPDHAAAAAAATSSVRLGVRRLRLRCVGARAWPHIRVGRRTRRASRSSVLTSMPWKLQHATHRWQPLVLTHSPTTLRRSGRRCVVRTRFEGWTTPRSSHASITAPESRRHRTPIDWVALGKVTKPTRKGGGDVRDFAGCRDRERVGHASRPSTRQAV